MTDKLDTMTNIVDRIMGITATMRNTRYNDR